MEKQTIIRQIITNRMNDMRRTFANMILVAVLSAFALQSRAADVTYSIAKGDITGGTVKIYAAGGDLYDAGQEISEAAAGQIVYIVTTPDYCHTSIGATWTVQPVPPANNGGSRAGDPADAATTEVETVGVNTFSFTMPEAENGITIGAAFPEKQKAETAYYDPTAAGGPATLKADAYILDGTESKLGAAGETTWYVCTTPATDNDGHGLKIGHGLILSGDVRLILADGCKMTVSAESGQAFDWSASSEGDLTVFAQSTGSDMGQLTVRSDHASAIVAVTITINGGIIDAWAATYAINNDNTKKGGVFINGGIVSANGTGDTGYGIFAQRGVMITGGQVIATGGKGGIYAEHDGIDIAISSPSDFVLAKTYSFNSTYEKGRLRLATFGTGGKGCYLAATPVVGAEDIPFAYVAGGASLTDGQLALLDGKRFTACPDGLEYVDAKGKLQNISTDTYTDGNGEEKRYTDNDITHVLEDNATALGAYDMTMWYACTEDVTCTSEVFFFGDLHLILADVKTMSVYISNADYAFRGGINASLTVYGQSLGSGQLIAKGRNTVINIPGNFTLIGGNIFAKGETGINTVGDVTIFGGALDVTGSNSAVFCNNNFTFNGGKVTAVGGNYAGIRCHSGEIILGFTNPDDYIYATSYLCGTGSVKTAAGKRFVAYRTKKSPGDEGFDPNATTIEATAIIGNAASTAATAVSAGISLTHAASTPTIAGKTLRPLVITEPDGQGGTTVSAACLLGIVPGDITPADKTAPDFKFLSTPCYIYKASSEGTTIPLSVPDYGQQGADFTVSIDGAAYTVLTDPAVTIASGKATAALPWTGAHDVELRDARYYITGVKYLEWDDAEDKLVQLTTSTDADNLTKVYILPGGAATNLPGGWYVVNNHNTGDSNNGGIDAQYSGALTFTGDAHLIIADGAKMQFGTAESPIDDSGIRVISGSLAIHAQTEGASAGTLIIFTGKDYNGIYVKSDNTDASLTLNGVNATRYANKGIGIYVTASSGNASVTINGGIVDLTENRDFSGAGPFEPTENSQLFAIYASSGANSSVTIRDACVSLYGSRGSIYMFEPDSGGGTCTLTIQGGQIHDYSKYGISLSSAYGNSLVTLGWKNINDYIYIPQYTVSGDISIASEQYLMACDAVGGSGKAFGGTLKAADIAAIQGNYLQPAIYSVSAPDRVILAVTDGTDAVEPFTIGDGDAATPYYIYKEGLTVSASLKNEDMQADFTFKNAKGEVVPGTFTYQNTQGATATVTFDDSSTDASIAGANAVRFTMPDDDVVIDAGNVGVPAGDKLYLAFVDNSANVTTSNADVVILVYQGLQMNAATGAIEALFKTVGEVPKDLPVIFANKTDDRNLPATIPVAQDNSDAANTLAETIRSAASPFFMTGTTGNWLADILIAALTGADGNPLTNNSGFALSQEVSDYVFFLFADDRFVPVSATTASQLSGRRYLLAVEKTQLLQLLYGTATPAPARAAAPADAATTAATRAAGPSDGVRAFPLVLGNDATAISGFTIDTGSPDGTATTAPGDRWYDLQGRKLSAKPTRKGIYLRNGQAVVIK